MLEDDMSGGEIGSDEWATECGKWYESSVVVTGARSSYSLILRNIGGVLIDQVQILVGFEHTELETLCENIHLF
jgi:hypothetical protein